MFFYCYFITIQFYLCFFVIMLLISQYFILTRYFVLRFVLFNQMMIYFVLCILLFHSLIRLFYCFSSQFIYSAMILCINFHYEVKSLVMIYVLFTMIIILTHISNHLIILIVLYFHCFLEEKLVFFLILDYFSFLFHQRYFYFNQNHCYQIED